MGVIMSSAGLNSSLPEYNPSLPSFHKGSKVKNEKKDQEKSKDTLAGVYQNTMHSSFLSSSSSSLLNTNQEIKPPSSQITQAPPSPIIKQLVQNGLHTGNSNLSSIAPAPSMVMQNARTIIANIESPTIFIAGYITKDGVDKNPMINKTMQMDHYNLTFAIKEIHPNELLMQNALLAVGCQKLITSHQQLFTNSKAFIVQWQDFMKSDHGKNYREFSNISEFNTANLDGKGYHNIGHAKEMFYDAYEAFAEQGFSDSTCIAGATMAFFHDLVQGLDTPPNIGLNEDATAQFVKFLIEQGTSIDIKTAKTMKLLADAIIVGGTFLAKVLENGENKNRTLSEFKDKELQYQYQDNPNFKILTTMRNVLAHNDISRTVAIKEKVQTKVDPQVETKLNAIKEMKKGINDTFSQRIKDSNIASSFHEMFGKDLVSRFFQSLRMKTEFAGLDRHELFKNFKFRKSQ